MLETATNVRELSFGDAQEAAIELRRETYPGVLNVTFTRGFVSSQAFVDRYVTKDNGIETLLPQKDDEPLDFVPTHPEAEEALASIEGEEEPAAGADDETFLEEEEEDGADMTGIIGGPAAEPEEPQ